MRRPLLVLAALLGALAGTGTLAVAEFTESTTNAGSAFSAAASFSPVLQSVPDVLGAPRRDAVLSAGQTDYLASLPPTARSYQWQRCNSAGASCVAIVGATAQTYTVATADTLGSSTLRVVTTDTRGTAPAVVTSSDPTAVVQSATTDGVTPIPFVDGAAGPTLSTTTPAQGVPVTVTNGVWQGVVNGYSYTYQWQRCGTTGTGCQAIAGATTNAYTPTVLDQGSRLRAAVTARNSLNATAAATAVTLDSEPVP